MKRMPHKIHFRKNGCNEKLRYDAIPNLNTSAKTSASVKELSISSSRESEFSLVVEIANSLKNLICSTEKYDSELLDVTIVPPSERVDSEPLVEKTSSIRGSEIRNILVAMEREKANKRKDEETKRKQRESRIPKSVIQYATNSPYQKLQARGPLDNRNLRNARQRTSETNLAEKRNISGLSICTRHVNLRNKSKQRNSELEINTVAIDLLKPLVGEIQQSLRNLEARIVKVGEEKGRDGKGIFAKYECDSSTPTELMDGNYFKHRIEQLHPSSNKKHRTQQIYATPNTFDNVKKLLQCQNLKQNDNEKPDRPCLCQHCGIIGVLTDSQKRPTLTLPLNNNLSHRKEQRGKRDTPSCKQSSKPEGSVKAPRVLENDIRNASSIDRLWSKVKDLEYRIEEQEKHAITKEYFKKVLKKIIVYCNVLMTTKDRSNTDGLTKMKNNTPVNGNTNVEKKLLQDAKFTDHNHLSKVKESEEKSYFINPLVVKTYPDQKLKLEKNNSTSTDSCQRSSMDIFDIVKEVNNKLANYSILTKEENNIRNKTGAGGEFQWGEDIIKPGFDLKSKVVNLLQEHLLNLKFTKSQLNNRGGALDRAHFGQDNTESEKNEKYLEKPGVQCVKDKHTSEYIKDINNSSKTNISRPLSPKSGNFQEHDYRRQNIQQSAVRGRLADFTKIGHNLIEERKAALDHLGIKVHHSTERMETCNADVASKAYKPKEVRKSYIPRRIAAFSARPFKNKDSDKLYRGELSEENKFVCVTYLNPKASRWNRDSLTSVELQKLPEKKQNNKWNDKTSRSPYTETNGSDLKENKNVTSPSKLQFLQRISTSKSAGKEQLWNSILQHVRKHETQKRDKIIIQLSRGKDCKKHGNDGTITEKEFTVAEILDVINKSEMCNKSSNTTCNTATNKYSCIPVKREVHYNPLRKAVNEQARNDLHQFPE